MKQKLHVLLTVLIIIISSLSANATTLFVDHSASGSNDGSSWTDAYTSLQSALDAAVTGDEIWVAK
ncbi:MAG: right-handed parallel beta-helix repeat-containing protein, partial [Chlorobi bacterium]|nr:right-handed parallel beta-helix repeat-containing protein [Chlorobiota bacterium]